MLKAFQYIRKYHMIEEQDCIIVGVSGGADSVCLLFVLLDYQKTIDFSIVVVHVEHGIRGEESLKDADFVESLCQELGIPYVKYSCDCMRISREHRISVEEAGRNARYESLSDAAAKYGGTKIAVAHNENDQAETILWNLVRGTGLRGMGGTKPVRDLIIRPLLGVSRKEIEEYLDERGISFCTDQTNLMDDYTRNKLRLHVLPYLSTELNHHAAEHIAQAGMHLQKVEAYLQEAALAAAKDCVSLKYNGYGDCTEVSIVTDAIKQQPDIIREYLFRYCLEVSGCGLRDIGSVHFEAMENLISVQSGREIHLPGEFIIEKNQQCMRIISRKDEKDKEVQKVGINIPGTYYFGKKKFLFTIELYENQIIEEKAYTKWMDYDKISNTICLRTRLGGDYFITNQDGGRKKLKSFFIDEKISREERGTIPLIAEGAHILWVVGYRISQACKVTKDTKRLLKIQVMEDWKDE